MNNNIKNSLNSIQNSIASFDNKATSLLTAVGIIFSFSLLSLDTLEGKELSVWFYISAGLYLLSFLVSIVCLILVIVPRGKTKKEKEIKYNLYQRDIYECLDNKDFNDFIKKEPTDEVILSQVKSCVKIAHIKEILLLIATIALICMAVTLASTILLLVI